MQIFEFELIDQPAVTTPGAATAPIPASARAIGREPLLEYNELVLARPLSLSIPLHRFASVSASPAILH
jgi:hypothetical protein